MELARTVGPLWGHSSFSRKMNRERGGREGGKEGESDLLVYFSTVVITIFQFMGIYHRSKYSLKMKRERERGRERESDSCAYLLQSMGIFYSNKLTHECAVWKFAATIFKLQQLYFIYSKVFNLQHVPCGPPYHVELGQLTYPLTTRRNVVL